jgi:hypothetical protein
MSADTIYNIEDLIGVFRLFSCDLVIFDQPKYSCQMDPRQFITEFGVLPLICGRGSIQKVNMVNTYIIKRLKVEIVQHTISVRINNLPLSTLEIDPESKQILEEQKERIVTVSFDFDVPSKENSEILFLLASRIKHLLIEHHSIINNQAFTPFMCKLFYDSIYDLTSTQFKHKFLEFTQFSPEQYYKLKNIKLASVFVTGSCMAYVGGNAPLESYKDADINIMIDAPNIPTFLSQIQMVCEAVGFPFENLVKINDTNYKLNIPDKRPIDFYMGNALSIWQHHLAPTRMYLNNGRFMAAPSAASAYKTGIMEDIRYVSSIDDTPKNILLKYIRRGYKFSLWNFEQESPTIPSVMLPVIDSKDDDTKPICIRIVYKNPNFNLELCPIKSSKIECYYDETIDTDFYIDAQPITLCVRTVANHYEFYRNKTVYLRVPNNLSFSF